MHQKRLKMLPIRHKQPKLAIPILGQLQQNLLVEEEKEEVEEEVEEEEEEVEDLGVAHQIYRIRQDSSSVQKSE
ncbi:uncharacterized protein J4E79_011247 [Alternaria viburni]|uniref:uncharacterized protein n=1 Tax=Alternaria viburni TaxID=566460 RepID=UPI0020C2FAC4|nr:uncharacterized protein J4E79_011247 [Alternaria viburni]KAI4643307.1 hypothetical protein J4E79_011247 [Alternaria viburni]